MKKLSVYIALLLAGVTAVSFAGCEKQKAGDSVSDDVSVSEEISTGDAEIPTEAEIPPEIPTENPEIPAGEPVPVAVDNADYRSVLNAYHQAYIDGNADAVYALFNEDEVKAFDKYMKDYIRDKLNQSGATADSMMSKENIMSSINASIDNIQNIMKNYNNSESDIWNIQIDDSTIEHYSASDIAQINTNLGITITDAYVCEIPFYRNTSNNEVFVAEPATVVQINGLWYISYSTACDRLVEFMNFDF